MKTKAEYKAKLKKERSLMKIGLQFQMKKPSNKSGSDAPGDTWDVEEKIKAIRHKYSNKKKQ